MFLDVVDKAKQQQALIQAQQRLQAKKQQQKALAKAKEEEAKAKEIKEAEKKKQAQIRKFVVSPDLQREYENITEPEESWSDYFQSFL